MTTPQNGADLLARIRPHLREESTKLCLRPDLLEAWQEADEALTASRAEESGTRMADGGITQKTRRLAKKVQEIEAEIEANFITFTFRALPKDEWRQLCDQHPPRKDNQGDAYLGYNRDAVLDAAVRMSLIDPVFDDASWAEFLKVCNPTEWNELREVVQLVNRGVTAPPKSQLASQVLAKRGTTSK